jgi:CxxC motif-containing protein (DUF1111 family)
MPKQPTSQAVKKTRQAGRPIAQEDSHARSRIVTQGSAPKQSAAKNVMPSSERNTMPHLNAIGLPAKIGTALTIALGTAALLSLGACSGSGSDGSAATTSATAKVSMKDSSTADVALTAVSAVASGVERNDLGAANAIDNNLSTRWSSAFNDQQWIYLDFGATATYSRVEINWENAHATDYQIQTSDDAVTWTTILTVSGSKGGTEDLTVSGSGRYLRMNGITRSTPYGYSIFEMHAWGSMGASTGTTGTTTSSGSGTSSGTGTSTSGTGTSTSGSSTGTTTGASTGTTLADTMPQPPAANPVTTSVGGASVTYVPLFAAGTPALEQIQYTEPDGTLVTRAGYRPTHRHARERGEYWYVGGDFDVASGPNNVDVGPGDYFTWPELYFQYREFGLIIRDGTPAGRSTLDVYQVVNQTNASIDNAYIQSSLNVFRDTTVGTYGWKYNQGFTNVNPLEQNVLPDNRADQPGQICLSSSQPLDCYMNWRLTNNWETNLPFKAGDFFEMTTAGFVDYYHQNNDPTNPQIFAKYDGGTPRFYSFEQLYVVGKGLVPWYGIAPALHTTPLPDDALLGGAASVSYNYSEEPFRVFQQFVNNIGITDLQRFVEGRRLFHTSFLDGTHSENPTINPPMTDHVNQLGPRYNSIRCLGCHALNGRSQAPTAGNPISTLSILTAATSAPNAIVADPTYGMNIQQQAQSATAPNYSVSIQSFTPVTHTTAKGETFVLQKPVYGFSGPVPAQYSVRQAPQVIGAGLLEAVDESTILQLATPHNGVSGVPNWVFDPETGQQRLGRFGWKASKASLRQQVAEALMLDMGVTSPVFPTRLCQQDMSSTACKTSSQTTAGVTELDLEKMAHYIELVGVPAQRSYASGYAAGLRVSPEHNVNPARIANGAALFTQAGCAACHVTQMKTGNNHPFAELRNQVIHPYTDLLLHDMGTGLADTLTQGTATPNLWRTQPLWGIGSLAYVQESAAVNAGPDLPHDPLSMPVSNARYLHDGRARSIFEAILWHDGEAQAARLNFEALTTDQRNDILLFLGSL